MMSANPVDGIAPASSGAMLPSSLFPPILPLTYSGPYSPAQIRAAYGFDKLSLDGAGQTIGIVVGFRQSGRHGESSQNRSRNQNRMS